jgi:hypothetical protein
MRYVLIGILQGIIFLVNVVFAQEPPDSRCQTLANQFSQNPDSLAIQELERLRFCISQALEHREQSLKGELLKGTIIEVPTPLDNANDGNPAETPKRFEVIP